MCQNLKMKQIIVPVNGKKVRDTITGRHIPETGLNRQIDSYLARRIADGDVEIQKPQIKTAKKQNSNKNKNGE